MLLVHGGFDFARTYDVFAPKLAAGGWRVVSWDQRGHGDSEHAELYRWDADIRDAFAVFDHVSPGRPVPVLGHSKGGALMTQLADAQPFRFTPSRQPRRHPVHAAPAGHRRARTHQDDRRRDRRLARPSPHDGDRRNASRARWTSWPSGGRG